MSATKTALKNLSLVRDAGNHTMRNLGRLLEQCKNA